MTPAPVKGTASALVSRITERLHPAEGMDSIGVVESMRLVKSPEELEYIRRAAEFTEAGQAAARKVIAASVTDREVAGAATAAMFAAGRDQLPISPSSPPDLGVEWHTAP